MERETPAWQPFDPEEPGPGPLSGHDQGTGEAARVLVLLAGATTAKSPWAPRAAVSLVRGLARTSGRALLADMDLREPRLHDVVGVANDEGVSDVFLWGASFRKVAHDVEPGLLFAPAGTVTGDPAAVADSRRWEAITDGFRKARATLALYLPAGAPGSERLLGRASDIVVLATREEAASMELGDAADRVRAVVGPAEGETAPRVGEREEKKGRHSGVEPAWRVPAEEAVPVADSGSSRRGLWIALGLVILLLVVIATWRGWVEIPYLSPLLAGPTEVVETSEGARAAPGEATPGSEARTPVTAPVDSGAAPPPSGDTEAPAGPVEAYALALAAYPDADSARERVATLSRRRPDVLFTVAPVEVNGQVFHRLLAGAVSDPASADALRRSLAETFGEANAAGWILREARWAWMLGRDSTLSEARARLREMQGRGIPAYVLESPTSRGSVYRTYAGAYAGPEEASLLGRLLAEAGITDATLVERTGRLPE